MALVTMPSASSKNLADRASQLSKSPATVRSRFTVGKGSAGSLAPSTSSTSTPSMTGRKPLRRSEEHTSELQSLMRISYAVFCLKKKKKTTNKHYNKQHNTE